MRPDQSGNNARTPNLKRGGRPTGSGRRRKTPITIEREKQMNRIGRVQSENVSTSSIRSRRNLADQLERIDTGLLVEAENVLIKRAMRERIRRANETPEEANNRLSLEAERRRNRKPMRLQTDANDVYSIRETTKLELGRMKLLKNVCNDWV